MMRTSWPLEPAAFFDPGVELAIGESVHAPRDLRVGERSRIGCEGLSLWALAASKTRQGARSEIRDDWLCCVRHDLVEPRVGSDGSTRVRTSANRP